MSNKQQFGGDWTADKLNRVRKYLAAYMQIMKDRPYFRTIYVDAFAGTGYNTVKQDDDKSIPLFPEFIEQETKTFLDGSARIALQTQPSFNRYLFIEKNPVRFNELENLKTDFPILRNSIELINRDANNFIRDFCNNMENNDRAVLFLDPFGMQVPWQTIEIIASTEKIDLWYLFPLGVAVNRLLKKNGEISQVWKQRLDEIFGTSDWYDAFYQTDTQLSMFGEVQGSKKIANEASISNYLVKRLKTVFTGVATNPLMLRNSKQSPLYLLCFASGNKTGAKTAIKIAQDILKR